MTGGGREGNKHDYTFELDMYTIVSARRVIASSGDSDTGEWLQNRIVVGAYHLITFMCRHPQLFTQVGVQGQQHARLATNSDEHGK